MNVREEVIDHFMQVAKDHGRRLAALTDDLALLDTGMDSLGFAIVVARLESALGVDPFSADEFASFPMTFGDFVRCYEEAAKNPASLRALLRPACGSTGC
jgi:acyl carrier protein